MPDHDDSTLRHPTALHHEDLLFRQSFLCRFQDPQQVSALYHLGQMLCDYLNETGQWGNEERESLTACRLRAVARDLQHIGQLLKMANEMRHEVTLCERDRRLTEKAGRWAGTALRLAA